MKLDTPEKIKKFLESNPDSSIIGKGGKQYSLVDGEVKVIEPNHYHTWDYVKKVHKDLTEIYKEHEQVIAIEESWRLLDTHYDGLVEREKISKQADSPLATLASLWEFTFYPPPEVMASIAATYNHYMMLNGEASLEEVFFGKAKKGLGSHSQQESRKSLIGHLSFLIRCDEINSRDIPQLQRAVETVELFKREIDPESLLRAYRRSKKV